MGKTFRRDSQFRPRKAGRVFSKEPPKKKHHNRPLDLKAPTDQ